MIASHYFSREKDYIFKNQKKVASRTIFNINSYEEAYKLAYELIGINNKPEEAIEVIKYIYNQHIPIKKKDIFYVKSLAALAGMPIYREYNIAMNFSERVIALEPYDYQSNMLLYCYYISENSYDINKAKEYALILLQSDYKSFIKSMESAGANQSRLQEIRQYKESEAEIFRSIYTLLKELGDNDNAQKALHIANEIKKLK